MSEEMRANLPTACDTRNEWVEQDGMLDDRPQACLRLSMIVQIRIS